MQRVDRVGGGIRGVHAKGLLLLLLLLCGIFGLFTSVELAFLSCRHLASWIALTAIASVTIVSNTLHSIVTPALLLLLLLLQHLLLFDLLLLLLFHLLLLLELLLLFQHLLLLLLLLQSRLLLL